MWSGSKAFFHNIKGKTIGVIGIGVSHRELIFKLAKCGAIVTLHDKRTAEQLGEDLVAKLSDEGIALCLGENYLECLDSEIIFRTPGMNFYSPAIQAAIAKGRIVTSELEVFLELCPCKTYGVTGSDGKTTTTTIIAKLLEAAGKKVHLGGNIGKALLPILDEVEESDVAVVELSSFQLTSFRHSPDVSVITNIAPNHLDVHKDMQEYIDAKKNIILHQSAFGRAVLSADNKLTADLASCVRGRAFGFSRHQRLQNGAWMDQDGKLYYSENGQDTYIMHKDEILIPGLHNVENYLTAITAVWGEVSIADIVKVAKTFNGVEHRIEYIRTVGGVKWYNDSIATSPTRVIAGLRSFNQKIIIIAGGYDKKIPFEPMAADVLAKVKVMILAGTTAPKIEAAITAHPDYPESGLRIIHAKDIPHAVELAASVAEAGDIVSLSPACASFDQFPNFEARGNYFKELVSKL